MNAKGFLAYSAISSSVIAFVALPVVAAAILPWLAGMPMRFSLPASIFLSILVFSVWIIAAEIFEKTILKSTLEGKMREPASFVASVLLLSLGFYLLVNQFIYAVVMAIISHLLYMLAEPLVSKMEKTLSTEVQ